MKTVFNFFTAFTFFIMVSAATVSAQTTVNYAYDESGNRIQRNVLTLKSGKITQNEATSQDSSSSKTEMYQEALGESS